MALTGIEDGKAIPHLTNINKLKRAYKPWTEEEQGIRDHKTDMANRETREARKEAIEGHEEIRRNRKQRNKRVNDEDRKSDTEDE